VDLHSSFELGLVKVLDLANAVHGCRWWVMQLWERRYVQNCIVDVGFPMEGIKGTVGV